jgi:hypothetical protein
VHVRSAAALALGSQFQLFDVGTRGKGAARGHQYDGIDCRIIRGLLEGCVNTGSDRFAQCVYWRVVNYYYGDRAVAF